jgi:ribosome-associated toxin RatA of RatAB toxin-antitoxin module
VASARSLHLEHSITVGAPADTVYQVLADATDWPQLFRPTVHVEQLESTGSSERLQIWALANDTVKTWTSRRTLDPAARHITFRQEVSAPPVASMGGEWRAVATASGTTELTLTHDFTAVDDDAESLDWIRRATDSNSETELANIKAVAESWPQRDELIFSFADSIMIDGPLAKAYGFLYEAGDWPKRLPHVDRLDLREDTDGIQRMSMDTRAANGSVHTTESIRVCFPGDARIVYKQLVMPPLLTAHVGEWRLTEEGDGVRVTSAHTLGVNATAVPRVLGADATVASARAYLQKAIGGNSAKTLALTKAFAENRDV